MNVNDRKQKTNKMNGFLLSFKDILKERRQEYSNFMWISRHLNPKVAYERLIKPTPNYHKREVLKCYKIQDIIERISRENGLLKEEVAKNIWTILNEIGFNKRLTIIRWLGLLLTKICVQVYSGIYVNDEKIRSIRALMGDKPIIFLPSHRSYADFILMSYLFFTYNIEIPAIAAGMDFYSMKIMGSVLRDTGAFFMRRSFNNDNLYWDTFRQYIHQLMTEGDLPLEFFIEGTRSRSGKSLFPKYGLLSMILQTFYNATVPDIMFVPISISYDRVLEEKLFAYELLGVPKPKETTSGFFKSLSIIKEHYGNIYIDFGNPISARTLFGSNLDRSLHGIKPTYMQEFTEAEKKLTASLALDIVNTQQKYAVITAFNLIAVILTNNFMINKNRMKLDDLIRDVTWIDGVLKMLDANTDIRKVSDDVQNSLHVHRGLVKITNLDVELVQHSVTLSSLDSSKLKGHTFSQQTMNDIIPFVMLQIYVNPTLCILANPAMITAVLVQHGEIETEHLYSEYLFLQELFAHEFVSNVGNYSKYEVLLKDLVDINLIQCNHGKYCVINSKLSILLKNLLQPFFFTYYMVCVVLTQNDGYLNEKNAMATVQFEIERTISGIKTFIHPYSLNLDTIANVFASFTGTGSVSKEKINGETFIQANLDMIQTIFGHLESYLKDVLPVQEVRSTFSNISLSSKL